MVVFSEIVSLPAPCPVRFRYTLSCIGPEIFIIPLLSFSIVERPEIFEVSDIVREPFVFPV